MTTYVKGLADSEKQILIKFPSPLQTLLAFQLFSAHFLPRIRPCLHRQCANRVTTTAAQVLRVCPV